MARSRYVALAITTILVGLALHRTGLGLSPSARDVLGDALWAAMMVWWVGVVAPSASLARRSVIAYAICVAVELSQLIHVPAIDAARRTTIGHLVLGSDFDPRDLAAYALGVAVAALLERAMRGARAPRTLA